MNSGTAKQTHEINLSMRKHMDISGVVEVVSFDEIGVTLKTSCGQMSIEGKDIKVNTLDTDRGIVSIDGRIDAIFYSSSEDNNKRGFFGRLLK